MKKKHAWITYIGRIMTPYTRISECPRHGNHAEEICTIEVFREYENGLEKIDTCSHLVVLYWLNLGNRRHLRKIMPQGHPGEGRRVGVFACRSPHRPNPIGIVVAEFQERRGRFLTVKGLDCLDGTPLVDLKAYHAQIDYFPEAQVGWIHPGMKP